MATRLEQYQARYAALVQELTTIGFIIDGSLGQISARCGKPNCRCKADPSALHGPYWQWSGRDNGKNICKRLHEDQAAIYREWIDNRRRVDELISQMKAIARKAAELQAKATSHS
jgi:hypothetical protein